VKEPLLKIGSDYSLDPGPVRFDAEIFTDLLNGRNMTQSSLENAAALYNGDYMKGEDYIWAISRREKLGKMYENCLINLSSIYAEKRLWSKAENALHKAYNNDPYDEMITRKLLELYKITEQRSKAAMHYRGYKYLLKKELGIEPHESLEKLCLSI
jgi:two-component SAPR family response regulator